MKSMNNKSEVVAVAANKRDRTLPLLLLLTLLIMAFLLIDNAYGQSSQSARSMGMADSYLLMSSNCEAATANPANLALSGRKNFSLKLASAGGYVSNNSFSLSDYKKYNGEYWTEADKQDILSKIPAEGLNFDANVGASAMSFSFGTLAVNLEVIGGGRGSIAKDPIELALMGNKVGDVIMANGSGGDSWAAAAIGVSYGRRIASTKGYDFLAGATAKYLQGIGYFSAEQLTAEVVTLQTGFDGEGGLNTLSATGGSGYAFDLGVSLQGEHTQYGLVARNVLASMNWTKDTEWKNYSFQFSGVTVENSDEDSIMVSEETEIPLGEFNSRPPLELEFGAARHFGKLLAAASVQQGFTETAFVSKSPRLAGGLEYPLISLLDVRGGVAFGGADRYSLATGLGFNFGPLQLDLAYATSAKLQPWDGNGAKLAISTILEF